MLDLGCGQGRISGPCGDYFSEVHGVDISPVMIERAKSRWATKANVFFSTNNGNDLKDFQDGYFDFCFSYVVFQHLPRLSIVDSYIREISRVLKPGGIFRIQVQTGSLTRFSFVPRTIYVPALNFLIEHDLVGWYSRMTMRDQRLADAFPGVITTRNYLQRIGASAILEGDVTNESTRNRAKMPDLPEQEAWFSGRKVN